MKKILPFIIVILFIAAAGVLLYSTDRPAPDSIVTNFEECANAGNPVMESYPRQCAHGGQTFVEVIEEVNLPPHSPFEGEFEGKCYIGGCSAQLCTDQPDMASTCEYREEYACYQSAVCERQKTGECGWTETDELTMCLNRIEI